MNAINTSSTEQTGDKALLKARGYLRCMQDHYARQSGTFTGNRSESMLVPSLTALLWRRNFESTNAPGIVRRGLWKFVRDIEERRIGLAEELIRRTAPGPFEDPGYLALLAYQAASAEMTLDRLAGSNKGPWRHVLLGTIHSPDVNAFAKVFHEGGHTVVMVYSALIDFVYQAAKAVVAASHPTRREDGLAAIKAPLSPSIIRSQLQTDREPIDRLYATLEAYFFGGYPRAFVNEKVKDESIPPLSMLVGMAERFLVAHEYGHKPAKRVYANPEAMSNPQWSEEFFADHHAMFVTVLSGDTLDRVPPEASLSGAVFALACADVLTRALSVIGEGKDIPDEGTEDHPPSKQRAMRIVDACHEMFDIQYSPDFREFDLSIRPSPVDPISVDKTVRDHVRSGAVSYANVLLILWESVRAMLKRDFDNGRPLHSMWTQSSDDDDIDRICTTAAQPDE